MALHAHGGDAWGGHKTGSGVWVWGLELEDLGLRVEGFKGLGFRILSGFLGCCFGYLRVMEFLLKIP